jgi:hypothetical protein
MRALWTEVVASWRLESPQLELLRLALQAVDAADGAHRRLAKEGVTVAGRYGPRTHPCVAIERDAVLRAARLFRQLVLEPLAPPAPPLAPRRGAGTTGDGAAAWRAVDARGAGARDVAAAARRAAPTVARVEPAVWAVVPRSSPAASAG